MCYLFLAACPCLTMWLHGRQETHNINVQHHVSSLPQGDSERHRCHRWRWEQTGPVYGQPPRHTLTHTVNLEYSCFLYIILNMLFVSCVESCSKRHHTGGRVSDHHGCTRNEYVEKFNFINTSLSLPLFTCFSFLLSVILPIIMQRVEKYKFMQVRPLSSRPPPPPRLCASVLISSSVSSQRITLLHGPIQVMLVGVL